MLILNASKFHLRESHFLLGVLNDVVVNALLCEVDDVEAEVARVVVVLRDLPVVQTFKYQTDLNIV